MAIGRHWEWRGFGDVSNGFRTRFRELPLAYPNSAPWGVVDDEYLWVPGCKINVKLRTGIEDGLKFKHLERVEEDVELWFENPAELYPYAKLNPAAIQALGATLRIELPGDLPASFDRQTTLDFLARARPAPKVVKVSKQRQTRVVAADGASLKIEIAEITHPEAVASIGMETGNLPEKSSAEELSAARRSVLTAIRMLGLDGEALTVVNYLDALEVWANGGTLDKS